MGGNEKSVLKDGLAEPQVHKAGTRNINDIKHSLAVGLMP